MYLGEVKEGKKVFVFTFRADASRQAGESQT